jgi:polysaccharide pyruvyl transferase WcaK-like protein
MYPDDRIHNIAGSKEFVLDQGRPLLLLPQTYGPFDESLERASRIVRRSVACFARDERSFDNLKSMLGDEFDSDRHRCGVDMAFGLAVRDPGDRLDADIRSWIDDSSTPTIGLNPSGLIGNTPGIDKSRYGFRADYRQTLIRFLSMMLAETDANVLLIPHVMSPRGVAESDLQMCEWLESEFAEEFGHRLKITSNHLDQCEVKWVISRMDWFCGTRMHATIAGLSTNVPTATISYSDKAIGVFETCGQGGEVFDPRMLEVEPIAEGLMDSYRRRKETRTGLSDSLRTVKERAASQMDEIAAIIESLGGR